MASRSTRARTACGIDSASSCDAIARRSRRRRSPRRLVVGLVAFYTVRLALARNQAVAEAERAQRIQQFTLGLFEGGDQAAGPADSLRAVTLVERGVRDARTLDAEPAVASGSVSDPRRDLSEARKARPRRFAHRPGARAKARALRKRESRRGVGARRDGTATRGAGAVRRRRATRSRGSRRGHADARAESSGRREGERGARPRSPRARAYDKAIPVLAEVVRINEATGARPVDIGASHERARRRALLRGALPDVGFTEYSRARDLSSDVRRSTPAGRRKFSSTWARRSSIAGTTPTRSGWTGRRSRSTKRSTARITTRRPPTSRTSAARSCEKAVSTKATVVLKQALAIRERVYGPVHPMVASTVNELASIAVQNNRYDEAEAGFRRMLSIYRAIYGDHHYLLGLATSNLGSVHMGRKDYAGRSVCIAKPFVDIWRRRVPSTSTPASRASSSDVAAAPVEIRGGRAGVARGVRHSREANEPGDRVPSERAQGFVDRVRLARPEDGRGTVPRGIRRGVTQGRGEGEVAGGFRKR